MKPAILLSLLLALPISAATISLTPSTPKAGDNVVVTIHDFSGTCLPTTVSAKLSGQLLTVDLVIDPAACNSACPAVVNPATFTTQPFTFSEAKPYTIEYGVTDCSGKRRVVATRGVLVRPQCAFDRSLTATPMFNPASGVVGFSWCDPSYSPFPDVGESATAYRVYVVRGGDAPILVDEHKASEGTGAAVRLGPTEAGATSAFVEADICDITIAGCGGISKVLKSNVVPLNAPPADCTFGGTALCLANRFTVTARYHTANGSSPAHPVAMTKDSGYFWFFGADNAEVVVKMVDACGLNSGFWFFAGGLTDVGVDLVVEDTKTRAVQRYSNPAGTAFQPIQDTAAFAGCP